MFFHLIYSAAKGEHDGYTVGISSNAILRSKFVSNRAHKTAWKTRAKAAGCPPSAATRARRQIGNVKAWAEARGPEISTLQVADRLESKSILKIKSPYLPAFT